MEQTESHSGAGMLIGLIVIVALVAVGILALGPISENAAEAERQRSAAVQAEAASRTAIAEAREATAQKAAALRAEQNEQIAGYLVLVVAGAVVCILIGALIGSMFYWLELVEDRRQARLLLLLQAQRQAGAYLPAARNVLSYLDGQPSADAERMSGWPQEAVR